MQCGRGAEETRAAEEGVQGRARTPYENPTLAYTPVPPVATAALPTPPGGPEGAPARGGSPARAAFWSALIPRAVGAVWPTDSTRRSSSSRSTCAAKFTARSSYGRRAVFIWSPKLIGSKQA